MQCTPPQRHCDVIAWRAKLLFYGNRQLLDLCGVSKSSCLIDVKGVLNRLYKAAATACTAFEWVGGAANPPLRHRPTQRYLE